MAQESSTENKDQKQQGGAKRKGYGVAELEAVVADLQEVVNDRLSSLEESVGKLLAAAEAKQPDTAAKSDPEAGDAPSPMERLHKLESCVAKMATLSGNANHLAEFGLKRWDPSKKDMQKYK